MLKFVTPINLLLFLNSQQDVWVPSTRFFQQRIFANHQGLVLNYVVVLINLSVEHVVPTAAFSSHSYLKCVLMWLSDNFPELCSFSQCHILIGSRCVFWPIVCLFTFVYLPLAVNIGPVSYRGKQTGSLGTVCSLSPIKKRTARGGADWGWWC